MLEFKHVARNYNDKAVLRDISFTVEKGEVIVLIGTSGCGKTTTLKMINKLIEPTSGQILIQGVDSRDVDPITLRLGIGYVTQKSGLIPHMSVAENIQLVPYLKGWDKARRRERTHELLELINLPPIDYYDKMPAQLSGGQQQRVSIARALASGPDLILMDEPFSALDPVTRLQLQNEVKDLQRKLQKTIVIVSHDMNEALRLADRIIFMDGGKIVQIGTPREFLTHPADEQVACFFSNASYLKNSDLIIAQDIALQDFPKVNDRAFLHEAASIFDSSEEEFVVVLDDEGRYKGYITARELSKNTPEKLINQIVLRKKAAVKDTTPSEDLIRLFQTNKYLLFLPIEDIQGKLTGIMTRSGIIDYIVTTIEKERQSGNV